MIFDWDEEDISVAEETGRDADSNPKDVPSGESCASDPPNQHPEQESSRSDELDSIFNDSDEIATSAEPLDSQSKAESESQDCTFETDSGLSGCTFETESESPQATRFTEIPKAAVIKRVRDMQSIDLIIMTPTDNRQLHIRDYHH